MTKKDNRETFAIKSTIADEIRKVIESGRPFDDVEDFVKRAVTVYLQWEQKPEKTFELFKVPEFPFTPEQQSFMESFMKEDIREKEFGEHLGTPKETELERQERLRIEENLPGLRSDIPKINEYLSDIGSDLDEQSMIIQLADAELFYDGYPLIWRFYSRILPAKIALVQLGKNMKDFGQKDMLPTLDTFRDDAYDIAEEIMKDIEKYEKEKHLKRNQRISTGFPKETSDSDERFLTQRRFKDQYIGKSVTKKESGKKFFEGALMALGLVRAFDKEVEINGRVVSGQKQITMTKLGRDFCMLENPVINGDYSRAFSDEESDFIMKKIIPERELEAVLAKSALDKIKSDGMVDQASLDELFLKECERFAKTKSPFAKDFMKLVDAHNDLGRDPKKQTRIMAIRAATMGRLAEIGKVDWIIGENGKSRYASFPKKIEFIPAPK